MDKTFCYKRVICYLAAILLSVSVALSQSVEVDTITESTLNNGVDVEGCHFEDGAISACAGVGTGSATILDLADDASNESSDLQEVATTGDTNSIFTSPSADKLLIDVGSNWPSSDTANALSANGANCPSGQYPLGVDASGAVESCTADADTDTNADTECAGTTTYLDGEGNCDDISSVYEAADVDIAKVNESETITGDWDVGGGIFQVPNSTSLPGVCDVGDAYMDTDETSGQRFYLCESTDTWVKQGDGSGSGSPGGSNTNIQFNNSGSFGGSNNFTYNDTDKSVLLAGKSGQTADLLYISNYLFVPHFVVEEDGAAIHSQIGPVELDLVNWSSLPASGTELACIGSGGLDSVFQSAAEFCSYADDDWASTDYPTRIELKVTADAASSPVTRFKLSNDGSIDLSAYDCSGNANGGKLTVDGTNNLVCSDDASASVGTDAIGTDELDDDANSPVAGDIVVVETGGASFNYLTCAEVTGSADLCDGNDADTDTTYTASGTLLNLTGTTFSINEGTLTNTKWCRYLSAGTQIACDVDPVVDTDTDTTYTASGTLLNLSGTVFSLNEGTLTDAKWCRYSTAGTQISCDVDPVVDTDTNTNADTICSGTTTYLDGEGNCDDISSVYAATSHNHAASEITSGALTHERGGLESDVSAYNGLVRIASGATSNVTNLSGLNTALGSSIADGAHTTNTNADTICSGTTTYLDGEGNCDTLTIPSNVDSINVVFDGGGSAISGAPIVYLEIPYAATITQVTMLADQSGSIVIDIWKDSYANYPPTDADSITASAVPTISSATKSQDSTLTGWTTSVSAGDILAFNVDSATTVTWVSLTLKVTK